MSAVLSDAAAVTPAAPAPPAEPAKVVTIPLHRHLARPRLAALFAAPVALVGIAWGGGSAAYFSARDAGSGPPAAAAAPDGPLLFARHCANCHGERGDGNGSTLLDPRARAFGLDKFKFAATENGVPTDADLLHVLRRGIPGSAMPSFGQLSEEEHLALIGHVRELTRRGVYDRLVAKAGKDGDEPDYADLGAKADAQCRPGTPLPIPPSFPPETPGAAANGRAVYVKICAACHGPEGRGDGPQVKDLKNDDGTPNRPRDLTLGLYKAGGDPAHLYARIRLGIPGTPMPASPALTAAEVNDLIAFVRSLAKPPAVASAAPAVPVAPAGAAR